MGLPCHPQSMSRGLPQNRLSNSKKLLRSNDKEIKVRNRVYNIIFNSCLGQTGYWYNVEEDDDEDNDLEEELKEQTRHKKGVQYQKPVQKAPVKKQCMRVQPFEFSITDMSMAVTSSNKIVVLPSSAAKNKRPAKKVNKII